MTTPDSAPCGYALALLPLLSGSVPLPIRVGLGRTGSGQGLKVGRVTRTTLTPRVRELVAAVPVLAAAIEPLLTAQASLRKSFTELHRQVLAVTRIDPVSRGS